MKQNRSRSASTPVPVAAAATAAVGVPSEQGLVPSVALLGLERSCQASLFFAGCIVTCSIYQAARVACSLESI